MFTLDGVLLLVPWRTTPIYNKADAASNGRFPHYSAWWWHDERSWWCIMSQVCVTWIQKYMEYLHKLVCCQTSSWKRHILCAQNPQACNPDYTRTWRCHRTWSSFRFVYRLLESQGQGKIPLSCGQNVTLLYVFLVNINAYFRLLFNLGTGKWNPSPWKTRISLSWIVNTEAVDVIGDIRSQDFSGHGVGLES